jgi:hypothetical protein
LELNEIFEFILSQKGRISLEKWIKECCGHAIGKIISRNVIREIKFENIPKEKIKTVFTDLDDYIEKRKEVGRDIVDQVKGFAKEAEYEKHLCNGNEIDSDNITQVSRVVLVGDMISHAVGEKTEEYLDDSADSEEGFKILQERIECCQKFNRPFGLLRGSLPIIWVTKPSELEQVKQDSPPEHIAEEVVKNLGMDHIKKGYLVEIQIPLQTLEKLHTPTVVDADFSECFCPADEPDKWGRTLRLDTLSQGLSEAVHPAITFEGSFPLFRLGKLGSSSGLTEAMEKFISRETKDNRLPDSEHEFDQKEPMEE